MKRENIKEAQDIIARLEKMETAVNFFDKYKDIECSPFSLFVEFFKNKRRAGLDAGYHYDYSIGLNLKQQEELAELLKKWISEDRQKLETL